ncbi:MAG: hypothetical protein K0R66_1260 [Gammaproteobacteria bacterium]|nr:hypothetical protein [Gammaproteobacteria bacterium]
MNFQLRQNKALLIIFAAYIIFRLYAFFSLPLQNYRFNFDAIRYLNDAHCSLLSACLYIDRPFFYPLFIKIWGYHYLALTLAQCVISILAWGFIAYCVKKQMQSKLIAYTVFSFILLYSCADYLTLWDSKALTESLSISFLLFFIGFYILALQDNFSKRSVIGLILFGFLLVNVRDGNAYLVLISGISTLIASFMSKSIPKKAALFLLIVALLTFFFNEWTANLGQRWLIPMADLLANRIISEPSMLQYFLKAGMPDIVKQVQAIQGTYFGYNILKANPAALNWFILHGRSVYMHYLLSHPRYVLSIYANSFFWQDLLLANNLLQYVAYGIPLYITTAGVNTTMLLGMANPFSGMLNVIAPSLIAALLIIGLVVYFENFKLIQCDKFVIFAQILLVLSIVVLGILIWISEPIEDMRHQLSNHLQIIISIILFSFKSLDCALQRKKQ